MYKLNNIDLANYGLVPGRAEGSNIAVSGIFDLPKRLGDTYRNWAEELEPYVDADEIFLGGRDIVFYGFIKGDRTNQVANIKTLIRDINTFTDLVVFSTDYGDYNVKVVTVDTTQLRTLGNVKIVMREPACDLSGGIYPSISPDENYIVDDIPLRLFGMTVTEVTGRASQAEMEDETFTIYYQEGYQITGRKPNSIKIKGIVKGNNLLEFYANIKALWKLFTDAGLRKLNLSDYAIIEGFSINGFTVSDVWENSNQVTGKIELSLIVTEEYIQVYLVDDNDEYVLITEENEILVYG